MCFFASFVFSKNVLSQTPTTSSDAETLKKLEYDWLMAEFRLDTATIALMMDEKFISIGMTTISNKQQELKGIYDNISERLKNNHIVDSLNFDDMHIQIQDNAAVVTFLSVTKGRINEVPFANRKTRIYDVWIKRNGSWKAISSQVTPVH